MMSGAESATEGAAVLCTLIGEIMEDCAPRVLQPPRNLLELKAIAEELIDASQQITALAAAVEAQVDVWV